MNNFSTNFGYTPKAFDLRKYTIDNINYGSVYMHVKNEIKVSDKDKDKEIVDEKTN